jgi:hypothetical protein
MSEVMKKDKSNHKAALEFSQAQSESIVKKKFEFSVLNHAMGDIKTILHKLDRARANLKY